MLHRGLWATEIAAGMTVDTGKKDEQGNPILEPKYTGFHSLRHWYASWCINRKADGLELTAKAVQSRMGHSSIQVTFDTYGHLFPSADEGEEMAAAERALFAINATCSEIRQRNQWLLKHSDSVDLGSNPCSPANSP